MKQILFSLAACLCVLAANALPSNAQYPPIVPSPKEASRASDFPSPRGNERDFRSGSERVRQPITDPYERSQIAQQQLASAQNDKEKSKAKETLARALSDCFDLDIKNRELELESIRNRLSKMEAQLKKRIDGKDEIVQLRLQVLANNASGLGWSEAPRGSFPQPTDRQFWVEDSMRIDQNRVRQPTRLQPPSVRLDEN